MVRPVEVEKPRRSNMAHSTVNAPAKKGGAGGSYTWGDAMEAADYEPYGIGVESIRVAMADASCFTPTAAHASFDISLNSNDAFPSLPASHKAAEISAPEDVAAEDEEIASDWVVVAPEADVSRSSTVTLADAQHPRHLFTKKARAKRTTCTGSSQERPMTIDWSQTGIPHEVKTQILKACMTSNHEGPYVKQQASTLPLDMFRAENVASKQRANSASREKSVPRSRSKPRMIKQPNGRH